MSVSGTKLPPLRTLKGVDGLLEGKVGIVTGASHGIGEAAATAMAEAGAKVVLAARNKAALEGVAERINDQVGDRRASVVVTDVTDHSSVRRLVEHAVASYGRLDLAFNNAGDGHRPAPLAELELEDFERAMGASAKGVFLCMKHEIPAMLSSGGGSIVNMSSTAGLEGVSGIAGYVAGKHAVIGLTKAAALDYAGSGIRINAVAPGPILSERISADEVRRQVASSVPIGRVGEREEVAATVVWLFSDLSSFVTGTVLAVDGGRMAGVVVPRPAATRGAARGA